MFCHSIFVVEGKWSSILTFSKSFGCAHSFSLFSSDSSFAEQREPFVIELQPEHFQSAEGSLKFLPTLVQMVFSKLLVLWNVSNPTNDWTLGQWRRWGARIRCKICKQGWKTQFPVLFRQNTCFFQSLFFAPFFVTWDIGNPQVHPPEVCVERDCIWHCPPGGGRQRSVSRDEKTVGNQQNHEQQHKI